MKKISKSTKKQYELLLNNIDILNLEIEDFDMVLNKIETKTDNKGTQKTYLAAILWYIRDNNLNIDTSLYTEEIFTIASELNNERLNNTNSKKEQDKFIKWQDLLLLRDNLKILVESDNYKSKSLHKFYVLICIYTMIPPRRIADYSEMFFFKKAPNVLSTHKNYFINEKEPRFIFHKYKTYKKYNKQDYEIPMELSHILSYYIIFRGIQNGTKIFDSNVKALSRFIAVHLKNYTGKSATVNTIRHSYSTYIDLLEGKDKLTMAERQDIANKMGHSFTEHVMYSKFKSI